MSDKAGQHKSGEARCETGKNCSSNLGRKGSPASLLIYVVSLRRSRLRTPRLMRGRETRFTNQTAPLSNLRSRGRSKYETAVINATNRFALAPAPQIRRRLTLLSFLMYLEGIVRIPCKCKKNTLSEFKAWVVQHCNASTRRWTQRPGGFKSFHVSWP